MIAVADPEKAAERHDRVGDVPRYLVDHQVVDRTQRVACAVIDFRALDLAGLDERRRFLVDIHGDCSWAASCKSTQRQAVGSRSDEPSERRLAPLAAQAKAS